MILAALGPILRSLPRQPKRFPDSLQLVSEHWINTKPRGELPPLPPLGVHPDQPEAPQDDSRLRGLIRKLGGPNAYQ